MHGPFAPAPWQGQRERLQRTKATRYTGVFMSMLFKARLQVAFSLLLVLLSLLFLYDSTNYPVSVREPLGPAFIPRWIAMITLFLSFFMVRDSWKEFGKAASAPGNDHTVDAVYRKNVLASLTIMVGYAALLRWPVVPSIFATPLFLFCFVAVLGGKSRKAVAAAIALALFMGVGLHLLFKNILYVNLP
jgi:hypothetical protein